MGKIGSFIVLILVQGGCSPGVADPRLLALAGGRGTSSRVSLPAPEDLARARHAYGKCVKWLTLLQG